MTKYCDYSKSNAPIYFCIIWNLRQNLAYRILKRLAFAVKLTSSLYNPFPFYSIHLNRSRAPVELKKSRNDHIDHDSPLWDTLSSRLTARTLCTLSPNQKSIFVAPQAPQPIKSSSPLPPHGKDTIKSTSRLGLLGGHALASHFAFT